LKLKFLCATQTSKEKYIGHDENWEKSRKAIIRSLRRKRIEAKIGSVVKQLLTVPQLDFMVKTPLAENGNLAPYR
jgi:threonyl-tRNA synthetase